MPAVIPVHASLRSDLRKSAENAIALCDLLEKAVAMRSRQPSSVFHGKADRSQPPWNAPVASAIMDLHAASRGMERALRSEAQFPVRERGSSGANTCEALRAVISLSEGACDSSVRYVTAELDKWIRRALTALGVTEAPKRLPRLPGEGEPACPLCRRMTLRMLPLQGIIRCIDPACTDENGKRLTAQMEYSRFIGDFTLRWSDMETA